MMPEAGGVARSMGSGPQSDSPDPSAEALAGAVIEALRRAGWSVALGESCTGGLVAKRLTDVAGSSDAFAGAVVAYADRAKSDLLGVSPTLIVEHGAVSSAVAEALARGAAARFGTAIGVGVTGIAGPGGGTSEKPVGMVWFGVRDADGRTRSESVRFAGDRRQVREGAAEHALRLLLLTANRSGSRG